MIYMLMQTGNIQSNLTGVNKMEKPKIDRKKSKIGEKVGLGLLGSKQAYEQSVGKRAYALGKNCKNLKGHVAEVMTCDKINLDPRNIIAGRKAWIIGMCGELRKVILLNLQQIVGIWCFLLWNISPEADLGEQQDGHPIEILKM